MSASLQVAEVAISYTKPYVDADGITSVFGEVLNRALVGVDKTYDVSRFRTDWSNPAANLATVQELIDRRDGVIAFPALSGDAPYRFSGPIVPRLGTKIISIGRKKATLQWDLLTPGIVPNEVDVTDVTFENLILTNNFDITLHDGGVPASVSGYYPLVSPLSTTSTSFWKFLGCTFTKTYRQAIATSGAHRFWLIDNCDFKDTSREALFFGSAGNLPDSFGSAFGHMVINSRFINNGDDVINFRNARCNIFANNYINTQGVNHQNPVTPVGTFSGRANASCKVHGDYNIFSGNVFESAGNRVFEVRSSSPGTAGLADGARGSASGNFFVNNTIKGTETTRENFVGAIAFAQGALDGGKNYVLNNHIEWISNSPFIEIKGPEEGYPDVLPTIGTDIEIRANTFNNGLRLMRIDGPCVHGRIEIEGNKFHNVADPLLIQTNNTGIVVKELVFARNRWEFSVTQAAVTFLAGINAGVSSTATIKSLELNDNRMPNGTLSQLFNLSTTAQATMTKLRWKGNDFAIALDNAVMNRIGDVIGSGLAGVTSRYKAIAAEGVETFIAPNPMSVFYLFTTNTLYNYVGIVKTDVAPFTANDLFKGTNVDIRTDGSVLTGTTGTAGRLTISLQAGGIVQVENRSGGSRSYRITWG